MNRDVCEHFNPVDLPCAKCEEKRKSEALFLADELEIPLGTVIGSEVHRRAAAELRRLYAENETLLEALGKMVAVYSGQVQNDGGYTVLDSVRPLITGRTALQPSAQGRISNDL